MFSDTITYTTESGIITSHKMIRHKKTIGLFLMLPGGNNASDRPIMHLIRKGMLDAGYDILNIDYTGLLSKEETFSHNCDRIFEVVKGVLLERLADYENKKISMFCRSIGSVIGMQLANESFINFHKIVVISPISMTIDLIKSVPSKIYFDPKDRHLTNESYEKLLNMDTVITKEYVGVGHNFEIDNDLLKTLDVLKDVVLDILEYLVETS